MSNLWYLFPRRSMRRVLFVDAFLWVKDSDPATVGRESWSSSCICGPPESISYFHSRILSLCSASWLT
jgi:hypothetical protein